MTVLGSFQSAAENLLVYDAGVFLRRLCLDGAAGTMVSRT